MAASAQLIAFFKEQMAGFGWETPRILAHLDDAPDFYLVQVAQVEQQLQVHVHDARDVLGALDVARHPVKRVGDAA